MNELMKTYGKTGVKKGVDQVAVEGGYEVVGEASGGVLSYKPK